MEANGHSASRPLDLWGGVECTCNRVGDAWFDQIAWTGHDERLSDLEQFAALGIRVLRYPALWEWAAKGGTAFNWTWADERLPRIRDLGMRPIVGLVHHGSGPPGTSLLEPSFAEGLATYARALAERFPWVEHYTPVNEPLTTARFSALYGHWYPHHRDSRSFATAILTQCRAVVLAMNAIRQVQPAAQLVQTEDLGKTYSTPLLAYQADFDNARRWLTFDLLLGRVDRHHPLGHYFLWLGVPEEQLRWFEENRCRPDLLGINYYVTSERFLDDRLEHYPPAAHGGNGRHAYADVEAVRARPEGLEGLGTLLRETADRYLIPMAITEAHLACYREEQVRWFHELWQAAESARRSGVNVQAVTAWSLLGAFDWNSLVTRPAEHYEPGVFDIRGPAPRRTALAEYLAQLSAKSQPAWPIFSQSGWWRREDRFFPHVSERQRTLPLGQPLVISGGRGTLASAFARICQLRGLPFHLLGREELDIADAGSVAAAMNRWDPWAIINAAGYVRVDDAEREADRCRRENVVGPATLAEACSRRGIPLVTFSTDLVFDGAVGRPYRESDTVNPLNHYGRTKVEAEEIVMGLCPQALVVRSSAFFGPWDEFNFVTLALKALERGQSLDVTSAVVSPTYVPDLVHTCLDLLVDRATGLWHVAGAGETSWFNLATEAACRAGLDPTLLELHPTNGYTAKRPQYSALGSEKAVLLPSWDNALARYLHERLPGARYGVCNTPGL